MKKYLYLLLSAALTSLAGCFHPAKPGEQLWMYSKNIDNPLAWDSALSAASFVDLRPDGQFTQDFGRFNYGTWQLKDQHLYLTDQHHKTYVYRIAFLNRQRLGLQLGPVNEIGAFNAGGRPPGEPEKDPFALVNNRWRIPPLRKETNDEIRQRLRDHCRCWEIYFQWAENTGAEEVEVHRIPTPLKIYANGLGLKHYDDLPSAWKSCFYDEEDCRKADTIIKHAFRTHNITWPKTNDDLKKFISGCTQVEQWLR